jgi:tRNA dimethylallyltransferase
MQAYRGMDIGTAKPTAETLSKLPHHLISFLEPSVQYNAGEFVKRTETLIEEISLRGALPVVSGGTAFYVRSFLFGLPETPAGGESRERLRNRERVEGSVALYAELIQRDPSAAEKIQPNDRYRTIRALEIIEATGKSVFSFTWPRSLRRDFRFTIIGLTRPREDLYRRIEARVDGMFRDGLVDEVRGLMESGLRADDPGMKGIGYREFFDMQRGCQTLPDVRENIKTNSRRYAKRQMTFFRTVPDVQWMDADDREGIRTRIREHADGRGLDHGPRNEA